MKKSNKKIFLQINAVANSGSTGRIAEELGQSIQDNGWDSYIAYGRSSQPSKSNLIKIGTKFNNIIHGLQTRMLDKHGLSSNYATSDFINKIDSITPDLIHIHNLHGYYINYKSLFEYLSTTSIPLMITLHDCWTFTGHCTHFDSINCEKWKTLCYDCPQSNQYPSSFLFDRSRKNYLQKQKSFHSLKNLNIVVVSKWLYSIEQQSFLAKFPTHVINNWVSIDFFRLLALEERKSYVPLANKFVILGVASNWNLNKGFDEFLQLSEKIDFDSRIVLVGLNKAQIDRLPSNVIGISRTENIFDLVQLYNRADAFVNLSREETFGMTTLEALACGTPAIVYDSTATPELISKETGFIVQKGNIQGIIESIYTIKRKGKSSYSSFCREKVVQNYSKQDRCQDYINLYRQLIEQNKHGK